MERDLETRCPTGIAGIDNKLGGGLPYTLSMLLYGQTGSGAREFAHTVTANAAEMIASDKKEWEAARLPQRVYYVSVAKPRSDILLEMSWLGDRREAVERRVLFYDLSCKYFGKENAISRWMDSRTCVNIPSIMGLVDGLAEIMDGFDHRSLIILDSISDLASHEEVKREEIARFLRGLQLATNKWDSLLLMLHTSGLLPVDREREILEASDAAVEFEHELLRAGVHRYKLGFKHMRGMPVPMTDLERTYAVLTSDGMRVMDLERVG